MSLDIDPEMEKLIVKEVERRVAEQLTIHTAELKEKARQQAMLLEGINRILPYTLSCETEEELGTACLRMAEKITGSRFGFIGRIRDDGLLHDIALSDPGWKLCTMQDKTGHLRPPRDLPPRGLYSRVLTDSLTLLTNSPADHPDSIGLPQGHPPLTAFLGVPLKHGGRTIGLIALANRHAGYRPIDRETIEFLAPAIAEALQHKRADKERREGEKRCQTLFESIDEGFCIIEVLFDTGGEPIDYRFLETNPAFEGQTGLHGAVGKRMKELQPRHEEHWFRTYGRIALSGKPERFMNEAKHLANRWYDVYAFRVGQPEERKVAILFSDITARKRAEEELLAAQKKNEFQLAKMEAIFDQMSDGLAIFDADGNLLDLNSAALTIHGFKDAAGLRRHLHELTDFFELFDLDGNFLPLEQWPISRVMRGETIKSFEILVRRRDTGEMLVVSYGGAPVRDRQGHLIFHILTMRDITESKRAEEELQKIHKLESIGLLAGGIAHDFNNILTAILGNITLARMFLPPGDKAAERLARAEQASMRARGLSQQLLTFARGGAPIKETLALPGLIRETVEFVLRGSGVKPECSFPSGLWPVEADENQLHQVISNLALNGVQAMPEGGILVVTTANEIMPPGNVLGLAEGNYVRIDIKDQGIGIPKEGLEKIFDPYYTTKKLGSGLGLTISFSIVMRHGGTITVDSTPGQGSSFSVYLPASKKKIATDEEVSQVAVAGTGRILVMDDEEAVSEVAAEMLRHLGYRVETVKDGAAALAAYRQAVAAGEPYRAVIADLTIPGGMGGKETVKHLLELDPGAIVIVSSGFAYDPIMSDFSAHGFKGVIAKPYKISELSRTLRDVLGKYHS